MPELLVELFSEEIPARMQARAAEELKRLVSEGLKAEGLAFDRAEAFATPRRLTLAVDGIPERQPDLREERRGPRIDAPEKAIAGFLSSVGLASVDDCEKRETERGTFLFAVIQKKGQPAADVILAVVINAICGFSWPKSMRWSTAMLGWVRPLHGVMAVFGGKPLSQIILLGSSTEPISPPGLYAGSRPEKGELFIPISNTTSGHRFLAPEPFAVEGFTDYKAKLARAKVVLNPAERRERIERGLKQLAEKEGLTLRDDPALLDEVTGLVEWPVPLLGAVDPEFMDLPPEVLTAAMRTHQRYFTLLKPDGTLAPHFGVVANMETADGGKAIVAGNERVLRARLADAKFFWDQDRKTPLRDRVPALAEIVFHAKLGTLNQKVSRIEALAVDIARYVPNADKDRVGSAARLCKADLRTQMVGEFPELQGVMGRYYALEDGEHTEVAAAIAEHYAPLGPNDRCPTAPVSVAVALADKIDTLVGFWLVNEKPTGSRDPYALRRAALGVIRLILENNIRVGLVDVFDQAETLILPQMINWQRETGSGAQVMAAGQELVSWLGRSRKVSQKSVDLLAFFADRLKVHLRERGVRHDLVSAVFDIGGEDDLVRLLARVDALGNFLKTDDGANLLVAYRRAANIVRIEEKKDKTTYDGGADPGAFVQQEEKALFQVLGEASAVADAALADEDFTGAMRAVAVLRGPVDAFFDRVTVNAEDRALRANRLRLLAAIGRTLAHVADFSKIEG